MEERTGWRGQNELSILGLLKKKEWPQCHRESSWQIHGGRLFQMEKNRALSPEYQIMRGERVKVSDSHTLAGVRMRSE